MEDLIDGGYILWVGTFIMAIFSLAVLAFIGFYKSNLAKLKNRETQFILTRTLELQNQERQRIAADLHDSICGDLSAIRNYLAILEQNDLDPSSKETILEIKHSITTVLHNTKEISYNMMPPLIEALGLPAVLEEHIARFKKMHSVSIELKNSLSESVSLSSLCAYEIFRIVQELLTNAIKYGGVSWIKIEITNNKEGVTVIIIDDGKPFLIKELLVYSEGLGVKNIFFRIRYIGAKLTQIPGQPGNHIEIFIPKPKQ